MIIDPYTWQTVPIQRIEKVAADTVSVHLPRPADYTFHAGQYAIIRATVDGMPLLRQYSLASAPSDDNLEIIIQRETDGKVSNWFHDVAAKGTGIELSQPFGNFLTGTGISPLLLIAGRVGIAPFLSILRQQTYEHSDRPLQVLYSVRDDSQVCYRELLDTSDASYFMTSSHQRLDEKTLKPYLKPNQVIYLCGSKRFVDGIMIYLTALGVSQDHIRRELFTLQ